MIKILTILTLVTAGTMSHANLLPGDTSFEAGPEEWLGGRSVARADAPYGHYVLELTRPYNHSRIYYGLVKAGQPYSLTLSVRCPSGPTRIYLSAWHVLYGQAADTLDIAVNRDWQRVSLRLKPQPLNRDIYFTVGLPPGVKVELDGLTLAPAPTMAYKPIATPIVGIAPTGYPGNILLETDPAPRLSIGVATGTSAANGLLRCKTTDFRGRVCASLEQKCNLEPGRSMRLDFPALPRCERGYYRVKVQFLDATGKELAVTEQVFGVVPKPLEITPEKSFFGLHPDAHRLEFAAMPRIGVKWIRTFIPWKVITPDSGNINDKVMQKACDAGQHNLAIMACIKLLETPPAWASGNELLPPDFPAVTTFFRQLAPKSPKSIKVWEIENEPQYNYPSLLNLPFDQSARRYGELVSACVRTLKTYDPNRQVAAHSDSCNRNGDYFLRESTAHCRPAADIAALHPYTGARYIGPKLKTIAPESYLRQDLLRQMPLCREMTVWAGEIGWAYDTLEPLDSPSIREFSDYVARTLILLRSLPKVEKVMWFKAQGCYEREHYQYGLWRSEFEPLPATVFFANIAHRLETAQPFRPALESDLRAYTFIAADGRPFAAVWKSNGKADRMTVDIPPERLRLTDLLGQPVSPENHNGITAIPLSSTPLWLEIIGASPEKLTEIIASAGVNIDPVSLNVFFRNADQTAGTIKNNLPRKQSVTLSVPGSAATPQTITLPASGIRSFAVPLPVSVSDYTITAVSDDKSKVSFKDAGNYLACPPAIDGWNNLLREPSVLELKERKYIYPPDPGIGWHSPEDQSGRFGWGWNQRYFFFAADIRDPIHFQPAETFHAWNGDSLQIAFDTMNDASENTFDYNVNDAEFIAWLSPKGPRVAKTFTPHGDIGSAVEGARCEITREGNTTHYRLALPWSAMAELTPLPGRIFGMNFIVNQNNGQGRRYWLGLTEGIGEMKYPWLYRRFILAPKAGAK